jgi:hypothetical protein
MLGVNRIAQAIADEIDTEDSEEDHQRGRLTK